MHRVGHEESFTGSTSADARPELAGDTPTLRLFALLEVIASKDQLFSLQGLVEETGLPKPTLHRMLQQLEGAGLLQPRRATAATTAPACACAAWPRTCCSTTPTTARATPCCATSSTELGESCNITALSGSEVVYLDRVETAEPLRFYLHPGSRVPAHCSASGKIFLAQMSPAQRRRLLAPRAARALHRQDRHRRRAARGASSSAGARATATRIDDEEFLPGLRLRRGAGARAEQAAPTSASRSRRRSCGSTPDEGAASCCPRCGAPRRRLGAIDADVARRRAPRAKPEPEAHRRACPTMTDIAALSPTAAVACASVFGIDTDLTVPAFSERDEHVPEIDPAYRFNPDVTLALLAGFTRNRRVMVQGLHGTGKSTHIEQVAARLNWPCVRVNLDGHISRLDLVGQDAVVLRDGQQVTEFQEGIVPWALQRPVALIFDEYDAGRPDVMFVIQRVLERDGKFTLMDQNRVLDAASVLPPVRHRQHRRPGQPQRPVPRRAAAQPRADRPLEHRRGARTTCPRDEEIAIVLARVPSLADAAGRALVALDGGAWPT